MSDKKVDFTGKEYLEYIKYQDSKPSWYSGISLNEKIALGISLGVISLIILILSIVSMVTTPSPTTFKYTWEGIMMFLAIAAGVGWMLHGTGFLLVRR